MATAFCAALRRRGMRVAPFKAQNMSNNSFVTLDGGEIGRAQAAQAEACGLEPTVEMNPILLKPSGLLGSQLVLLGKAREHLKSQDYYRRVGELWPVVTQTLEDWRSKCDVLVLEGAGSPVELNLMDRDIVNLRPVQHLNGRWVLVANIERGGVFAQIAGTWSLVPEGAKALGLGVIVNQFRGDISLFSNAGEYLRPHTPLPYLGVVPHRGDLQPESEDSLCREAEERGDGEVIAWIRFPHLSNSQDVQPWLLDSGIKIRWARSVDELANAKAVVLPGSKNTIADLAWLRSTGLDRAILEAAARSVPVIGICGGYQMLGKTLSDADGAAGEHGEAAGLGLLPLHTTFHHEKTVRQVEALWGNERWNAYEIHMGQTRKLTDVTSLLNIRKGNESSAEGCRTGRVWGTYLHGLFEAPAVRSELASIAGIRDHIASETSWKSHMRGIYDQMADLLEEHVDMASVWKYLEAEK